MAFSTSSAAIIVSIFLTWNFVFFKPISTNFVRDLSRLLGFTAEQDDTIGFSIIDPESFFVLPYTLASVLFSTARTLASLATKDQLAEVATAKTWKLLLLFLLNAVLYPFMLPPPVAVTSTIAYFYFAMLHNYLAVSWTLKLVMPVIKAKFGIDEPLRRVEQIRIIRRSLVWQILWCVLQWGSLALSSEQLLIQVIIGFGFVMANFMWMVSLYELLTFQVLQYETKKVTKETETVSPQSSSKSTTPLLTDECLP